MLRRSSLGWSISCALGMVYVLSGAAQAKEEPFPPQFKYAGGTENVYQGCEGNLELNPQAMTFKCLGGAIDVPYSAITLMQYRSDISRKVRRMKVKCKVRPNDVSPIIASKKNRFFTVVYQVDCRPHVIVLRVQPQAMRPYLAELDLRAQQRVEVQGYEEY